MEAIEKVVDEALDEVGLQSQSAAELGSDSPAPIPSVPTGVLRQRPIGVLPSGEVSLTAEDRSAIEDSVDELGVQLQSALGPGSDSPAPAPSAPLFTGARGAQVTQPETEEINPALLHGVWQSDCSRHMLNTPGRSGGHHLIAPQQGRPTQKVAHFFIGASR